MKGRILIHPHFNKDNNPFYVSYKVTLMLCVLFLSVCVYILYIVFVCLANNSMKQAVNAFPLHYVVHVNRF